MITLFLSRRRIPQLSPLLPVRLRHQRVRLQNEPHHLLHRPHVLPGPGQGPQDGVPRDGHGPNTAHRRRELPQWLGLWEEGGLICETKQPRRRRRRRKSFTSPLTAIHFSSSEDKTSALRRPRPHFACFYFVGSFFFSVAVTKQSRSGPMRNTFF